MEKIYIFGHKKPDTDSVTSAICLSYLKKAQGMNTVPAILGDLNNETKFVLEYWGFSAPKELNDVRLQIKNLNFERGHIFNEKESIYNGYQYMSHYHISTLPIINDNKKFQGAISMKDIAMDMINGDFERLCTSYNNITDALEGKPILKFDEEIDGKIMVASYKSTTFIENIPIDRTTVLIVADRHSIIEYAVESGAQLIILTGDSEIKEKHLEIARQNKVNIIKTNFKTFKTTRRIGLCNYISTIVNKNVIVFNEKEYVSDFIEIANRTKHSNYPVINQKKECLGFLKLADTADKKRKKVILVDHNEYEQSVDGLEEAEIIEIIDHHRIGTIGTSVPINFRNMPVGSTNTIIYILYHENQLPIPDNIAGLMMSGILSDTLLFKSPTTTPIDKQAVFDLAAQLDLDYQQYAMNMFKAGSSLAGKTLEEILYTDFKNYEIENHKVGIGQISTTDIDSIMNNRDEYIDLIEKLAKHNEYDVLTLFVTDIIHDGSYVFFNSKSKTVFEKGFEIPQIEEGHYFPGIISRKKQIVPNITEGLS